MSDSPAADVSRVLRELVGRQIVVDTDNQIVYAGTLEAVDEITLTLGQADVHDMHDTPTTKEIYILATRKHGVRHNRERVVVFLSRVVSFSRLEDIVPY